MIGANRLGRLVSVMGNGAVKIVTGVRRCGKSYLLNTIFRNYLKKQGVRNDHIIPFLLDATIQESVTHH